LRFLKWLQNYINPIIIKTKKPTPSVFFERIGFFRMMNDKPAFVGRQVINDE
jgi:hypothetical protein